MSGLVGYLVVIAALPIAALLRKRWPPPDLWRGIRAERRAREERAIERAKAEQARRPRRGRIARKR